MVCPSGVSRPVGGSQELDESMRVPIPRLSRAYWVVAHPASSCSPLNWFSSLCRPPRCPHHLTLPEHPGKAQVWGFHLLSRGALVGGWQPLGKRRSRRAKAAALRPALVGPVTHGPTGPSRWRCQALGRLCHPPCSCT